MLKVGHKSAAKDPKRFVNTPVYGAVRDGPFCLDQFGVIQYK
jgi:hypothetical protein